MAKGFKHGAGGARLNFRVVGGTTAPDNPNENTIWVNTDVKITGWYFDVIDPSIVTVHCPLGISGAYLNSSGSQTSSSSWLITEYTKIPENTKSIKTVFSASSSTGRYHAFYDAEKNRISTVARKNNTNSYTVPEGAVYIRMTVHTDDKMDFVATFEIDNGMVWITTGSASPVAFNALKKNGIQVYPVSAKQYVSGAWVTKEAMVYQGGKWNEWVRYLFYAGDTCEEITGGWHIVGDSDANVQKNIDNHYIALRGVPGADTYVCYSTVNKIDLTNASKIILNDDIVVAHDQEDGGSETYLIATKNLPSEPYMQQGDSASVRLVDSSTLDVSKLSGSYYVALSSSFSGLDSYYIDLCLRFCGIG